MVCSKVPCACAFHSSNGLVSFAMIVVPLWSDLPARLVYATSNSTPSINVRLTRLRILPFIPKAGNPES